MPKIAVKYKLTENAKKEFQYWLICHDLTINKYAKLIGWNHQYLYDLLNGKLPLTESAYKKIEKGGYSLPIEKVEPSNDGDAN